MQALRTFRIHELGCKVNQYEGQLLREGLRAIGLSEASDEESCDLFLVNSCSVTESGGAKSRHKVRHGLKASPDAKVIVTGCYAESDREIVEALPGVVRTFGNAQKDSIVPYVARQLMGMDAELPELPRGITHFAGHTRAFLKIQDGCRDQCSFCIIPSLRGDIKSRELADILQEAHNLVASGHREIVLTGIHLGYYGWDRDEQDALIPLLTGLAAIDGLERIKMSSIEVHEINEELVELYAQNPKFVPHFHLPLQAGSDRVLKLMRRKHNTARFREAVQLLRSRFDRPALTTDLIVGHPGEGDEEFRECMAFCEEMAFAKMHIFPYSQRRGTHALELAGQVSAEDINWRKKVAADLDDAMAHRYRESFLGEEVTVLVEERQMAKDCLTGLTERFLRVNLSGPEALMNTFCRVKVDKLEADGNLRGVRLENSEVTS